LWLFSLFPLLFPLFSTFVYLFFSFFTFSPPKTAKGTDLMTGAPGTVDDRQLRELHVRVTE